MKSIARVQFAPGTVIIGDLHLDLFDPDRRLRRCALSGGIARNLPNLAPVVANRTGYDVLPATVLDESLVGLRTIALVAAGRAATCAEAQQRFGRECQLVGPDA